MVIIKVKGIAVEVHGIRLICIQFLEVSMKIIIPYAQGMLYSVSGLKLYPIILVKGVLHLNSSPE